MAKASGTYKAQQWIIDKMRESEKRDIIAEKAFKMGIIDSMGQKAITVDHKKLAMLDFYVTELQRQDSLASTGSIGKYVEVANRVKYSISRKTSIALHDFSCRNCQKDDIIITDENGKRHRVEIKTGSGVLAVGTQLIEAYRTLESWLENDDLIVWYYAAHEFDYTAPDALDELDYQPYICMTLRDLLEGLGQYKGLGIESWIREVGTSVQFQAVKTSPKKMAWLDEMSGQGYDWISLRDNGVLEGK